MTPPIPPTKHRPLYGKGALKAAAAAIMWMSMCAFVLFAAVQCEASNQRLYDSASAAARRNIDAAVAFADLCIADGRKRSDCWQACTQTEAWEACREQITSPRTRTGARR